MITYEEISLGGACTASTSSYSEYYTSSGFNSTTNNGGVISHSGAFSSSSTGYSSVDGVSGSMMSSSEGGGDTYDGHCYAGRHTVSYYSIWDAKQTVSSFYSTQTPYTEFYFDGYGNQLSRTHAGFMYSSSDKTTSSGLPVLSVFTTEINTTEANTTTNNTNTDDTDNSSMDTTAEVPYSSYYGTTATTTLENGSTYYTVDENGNVVVSYTDGTVSTISAVGVATSTTTITSSGSYLEETYENYMMVFLDASELGYSWSAESVTVDSAIDTDSIYLLSEQFTTFQESLSYAHDYTTYSITQTYIDFGKTEFNQPNTVLTVKTTGKPDIQTTVTVPTVFTYVTNRSVIPMVTSTENGVIISVVAYEPPGQSNSSTNTNTGLDTGTDSGDAYQYYQTTTTTSINTFTYQDHSATSTGTGTQYIELTETAQSTYSYSIQTNINTFVADKGNFLALNQQQKDPLFLVNTAFGETVNMIVGSFSTDTYSFTQVKPNVPVGIYGSTLSTKTYYISSIQGDGGLNYTSNSGESRISRGATFRLVSFDGFSDGAWGRGSFTGKADEYWSAHQDGFMLDPQLGEGSPVFVAISHNAGTFQIPYQSFALQATGADFVNGKVKSTQFLSGNFNSYEGINYRYSWNNNSFSATAAPCTVTYVGPDYTATNQTLGSNTSSTSGVLNGVDPVFMGVVKDSETYGVSATFTGLDLGDYNTAAIAMFEGATIWNNACFGGRKPYVNATPTVFIQPGAYLLYDSDGTSSTVYSNATSFIAETDKPTAIYPIPAARLDTGYCASSHYKVIVLTSPFSNDAY